MIDKPVSVVSFPRSGRTYFRKLVNSYAHGGERETTFDSEPSWIRFDHDFKLDLAIDPQRRYVILVRNLYRAIESYRALPDSYHPSIWYPTMESAISNWIGMYRKWVMAEIPAERIVICYEDLITYPKDTLTLFLKFCGVDDVCDLLVDKVISERPPYLRPAAMVTALREKGHW